MRTRTKVLGISGGVLALLIVAGGLLWYFVIRSDAPKAANLPDAVAAISTPVAAGTSTAATSVPAPTSPGLPGTWTVDATQKSFVGYRVQEQLARIGANTAVGRTSAVTGQVVIDGTSATAARFEADLTGLKSDSGIRDGQLRNQAIETSKFPKATFELSEPVALPDGLASGQQVATRLNGRFTLHGVTRDVSIAAQAQLVNGLLVVVGSLEITFSDYNVSKPNGASVLSIDDHGMMELQLYLKKS